MAVSKSNATLTILSPAKPSDFPSGNGRNNINVENNSLDKAIIDFLAQKTAAVELDQAYFWTKEWQEGEKEANEDIKKKRVKDFKNVKGIIKHLHSKRK